MVAGDDTLQPLLGLASLDPFCCAELATPPAVAAGVVGMLALSAIAIAAQG